MSDIASNLNSLRSSIPYTVKIIAVSKTKPVEDILEAYAAGQRLFGENRVNELLGKVNLLPKDIQWHLIGHLQTNKVKSVVPFVSMIQSVDTHKLLTFINSEAIKIKRVIDCLLQIHIAKEESKFGFSMDELDDMIRDPSFDSLNNIRLCGVMGMATFTTDMDQVRKEFDYLSDCFKRLKDKYFEKDQNFKELSMGMSGDYQVALEAGSTMIRIGTLIFGERVRTK